MDERGDVDANLANWFTLLVFVMACTDFLNGVKKIKGFEIRFCGVKCFLGYHRDIIHPIVTVVVFMSKVV